MVLLYHISIDNLSLCQCNTVSIFVVTVLKYLINADLCDIHIGLFSNYLFEFIQVIY